MLKNFAVPVGKRKVERNLGIFAENKLGAREGKKMGSEGNLGPANWAGIGLESPGISRGRRNKK